MTKLKQLIISRQRLKEEFHAYQRKVELESRYFREQILRIQRNIDYEVSKKKILDSDN